MFGGPPKPPGDSSTTTTAPATGGFFGLPPKPADSTATSTTSTLGGLFGTKKPETPGTSTPVPPTTGSSPFGAAGGSGLFGITTTNKDAANPEEKKDATSTTTTNLFGPPKDGDKKDGATSGTSTTTSGLGGLFGKPAEKKDAPAGDYTTLLYPLPPLMADSMSVGTTTSTDDKCKTAGTSSALTITAQPPSMLRGKTIEEIVNKWSLDLEAQVKEFSKFATEVAVWDRGLIDNGNSVSLFR